MFILNSRLLEAFRRNSMEEFLFSCASEFAFVHDCVSMFLGMGEWEMSEERGKTVSVVFIFFFKTGIFFKD